MNVTKKLFSYFVVLAVIILFWGTTDAKAAEMMPINTNVTVTDYLDAENDENFYSFTVDKSGYMKITLAKADVTENCSYGWAFGIYNKNGDCLHWYSDITTSYTTAELNYAKGTQLYIKVCAERQNRYDWPGQAEYNLLVNTVQDTAWEQEYNDSMASATLLQAGQTRTGHCINEYDEDYYVYTVDKSGYFTIQLSKADVTDNVSNGWEYSIYDASGNVLYTYSSITTTCVSQRFNFRVGQKYYIKVCAESKNRYDWPRRAKYLLNVTSVTDNNWEKESLKTTNDTWKSRTAGIKTLSAKKTYGTLWCDTDNDVYKLSVPRNGKVTLRFDPQNVATSLGDGYKIQIFNKSGELCMTKSDMCSAQNVEFNAKKGTYYVVISVVSEYCNPPHGNVYTLTAKSKLFTVPSMKSRKITYKSSSDTLKWKKVKKIDGYEIQVCKNKKFKKSSTTVYTSEKTSYELPWDLPNRTYYVRIAAYKDTVTGERVYGKFTKVKKIKKK